MCCSDLPQASTVSSSASSRTAFAQAVTSLQYESASSWRTSRIVFFHLVRLILGKPSFETILNPRFPLSTLSQFCFLIKLESYDRSKTLSTNCVQKASLLWLIGSNAGACRLLRSDDARHHNRGLKTPLTRHSW